MDLTGLKILLVDDEETILVILKGILQRAGYTRIVTLDDPRRVLEAFMEERPDLLVLDHHMPHKDGLEVIEELRPYLPDYFPILMLTGDERAELKETALSSGAKDFLIKPINPVEVRLRIRNLLEARYFHQQLENNNLHLEETVRQRTRELEDAHVEMLVRLAKAAEYRDDDTGEHTWRVARTCALLGQELGLAPERVDLLLRAARLHDVGKITIPDGILLKPGRLSEAEYEVVKQHTRAGAELLSGGRSPLVKLAETIALTHHERWDGGGYPRGLAGDAIPLESRLLAVADTFDALTHDRIHRKAVSPERAVEEITANSGSQFDPKAVDAFLVLFSRGELFTDAQLETV
ncbi:MAG TPA: HD domain-containing phosphohydrolase [Trueperaceae bacterium]|nr:HD domain-containing phosphohydrolase [Trueperaceae bacterium]